MGTDKKELKRKIDRLEDKNLELKNHNSHLEGVIFDLKEEIDYLKADNYRLEVENYSLKNDIEEQRNQKEK